MDALVRLAKDDMAAVDALIIARMQSDVPVIPLLAEHLVSAGGKRLRPLLTVAAARAAGQTGDIVWTFNRPGNFDFACLIAGHYQAGMTGTITVLPK